MAEVVAFIVTFVASVAEVVTVIVTAIATVVAEIVGAIVATIAPIIEPITKGIAAALAPILKPVSSIVKTLTGGLLGPLEELQAALVFPLVEVLRPINEGMAVIHQSITGPTAAILVPIRDTMQTVHDFVEYTQEGVVEGLEPVRDLASMVRDISHAKFVNILLGGTARTTRYLDAIANEAGLKTAGAIADLWRSTVDTTVAMSTILDDHVDLIRGEVNNLEGRLTGEQEAGLALVRQRIDDSIARIEGTLHGDISGVESRVLFTEHKLTEVPWFREMMVRALA